MLNPASVEALARVLRALGDENRLRIVALLSHGELCVCHVEEALELAQPTVSRHLAILRAAGLVEARREGTWAYYRLAKQADVAARRQLASLVRAFSADPRTRSALDRLRARKGPRACT